ncbi:RagB/SusD family nutrient uptake outer membrane protein [uncultured Fibrella sp.]|uniref:RagB/SusD family nutrient uptake outer membrane protein n=1 Tax=uncultured Fibrella sp. TaxID=1284596 RepID=UPI0035CC6A80
MRTYKLILSASLLTAGLLTISACKDSSLLEVKPRTAVNAETALKTIEGLDAGVNGIYDRLQSVVLYGRDMLAVSEALGDNAQFTNKSGRLANENRNIANNTFGTATSSGGSWLTAYFAINQANLILDNIGTVTVAAADTARRNSYQGQAYFLRALLYHDLMRIYAYDPGAEIASQNKGGVPLLLVGVADQSKITFPTRPAIADVYKQIYSDLQSAITALTRSNGYAAAPNYANVQAANALFSRVALYNKDYATAVKYATAAIAGSIKLSDNASYVGGWRAPKQPESLFEVQFAVNSENIGVNTSLQTTYTTLVRTGDRTTTGGFGDLVPTTAFIADLEAEKSSTGTVLDIRRQLYELGTTGRGAAFIESTKFLGKNGTINLDNVPAIRVSELYLNRAEANYFLGNTADALADLNVIRTRAGLPASTTLTGAPLLAEIYRQARLEFGFEGHRWFDLKRTSQNVVKAAAQGGGLIYGDFRYLAPIPVNELSTNAGIKQNFGY